MLKSGPLGFVDVSVFGYGDQGGPQTVYVLQGAQYLQGQPIKVVDGYFMDAAPANGTFFGAIGVTEFRRVVRLRHGFDFLRVGGDGI